MFLFSFLIKSNQINRIWAKLYLSFRANENGIKKEKCFPLNVILARYNVQEYLFEIAIYVTDLTREYSNNYILTSDFSNGSELMFLRNV